MDSQVKLLLTSTSLGLDLSNGAAGCVCPAMLEVARVPLIQHWVQAVATTTRLLPIQDKVFIAASHPSHAQLAEWAQRSGFPASNLLLVGPTPGSQQLPGTLDAAAAAIQAFDLSGEHLMVVELDSILEPSFSLQRLVEHALIRNKDSASYSVPVPFEDPAGRAMVLLSDPSYAGCANPRISAVASAPPAASLLGAAAVSSSFEPGSIVDVDPAHVGFLGPLLFLTRQTLLQLLAAARSGAFGDADGQMGRFFTSLLAAGKPVYGLPLPVLLPVHNSLASLAIADTFYKHQAQSANALGEAAIALAQVQAMGGGAIAPPGITAALADAEAARSTLRVAFLHFWSAWLRKHQSSYQQQEQQADMTVGMTGTKVDGTDTLSAHTTLPARFADHTTRRHNPRKQHPCYTTTSNEHGIKAVGAVDMPNVYSGTNGLFSRTFTGGMVRDGSLVTSIARSKVHVLLDEF